MGDDPGRLIGPHATRLGLVRSLIGDRIVNSIDAPLNVIGDRVAVGENNGGEVDPQTVINHNLFLGNVDDDYEVHVFGITSRFRY